VDVSFARLRANLLAWTRYPLRSHDSVRFAMSCFGLIPSRNDDFLDLHVF
jgi:hypothetical protein